VAAFAWGSGAHATSYSHTWNIAQGNNTYFDDCGPNGLSDCATANDAKLNAIKFMIAGQTPLIVALQEICSSQSTNLKNWATAYGYTGYYKVTQPSPNHCPPSNTRGNLVLGFGSRVTTTAHQMLPDDGEDRWIGCQKTQNWVFAYTVCSLHASANAANASDQAWDGLTWWTSSSHPVPWLFGGDFNNDPQAACCPDGVEAWDSVFWEFQNLGNQTTTVNAGIKLDYIFADTDWPNFNGNSCTDTDNSDHYFCIGTMP
jgi:endonuclease/exonuclease/phosphatase family metal-dependent hydrolase